MASSNLNAERFSSPAPAESQKGKGLGAEKAPRWRTACNACHDAKVRCTGERDGCARCRENGQQCIFLVSRVGKARGSRKRRNRIDTTSAESSADTGRFSTQAEACTPASQSSAVQSSAIPALDDDTFLSWSAKMPGDMPSLDTIGQLFSTSDVFGFHNAQTQPDLRALTAPRASGNSLSPPVPGDGASCISNSLTGFAAQPGNNSATLSPTDDLVREILGEKSFGPSCPPSDKGQSKDDGRFVIACAELVAHLEVRQRDGFFAMDEILVTNREAADRINQLILSKGFAVSASSSVILTAAAEHVVSLFETGVRDSPLSRHTVPPVGFGVFSIDPAVQEALRRKIVSKELRFNAEVIRKLSTAIMEKRDSTNCKLRTWLQELEERMQTLISAIEEE